MRPLPPARIDGVLEVGLYVSDLARSRAFYRKLFDARELLDAAPRLVALAIAERQVLLLFDAASSHEPQQSPGGTIPGHGASGQQHLAFAIGAGELPAWLARLEAMGLPVESRVKWSPDAVEVAEQRGESVYFRDPDGHSIELVTPGLWGLKAEPSA